MSESQRSAVVSTDLIAIKLWVNPTLAAAERARCLITICCSALSLLLAIGGLLLVIGGTAQAQASSEGSRSPPLMDRDKEIALALSACPTAVANQAGVYVLDKGGYVKVRDSQNGFTAIVQHSLLTSQEPQCMDAEGARTLLPRILMVAELRAQGKSPDEIKRAVAGALAKGVLQVPRKVGIDYMLSTGNLVPDDNGVVSAFPPHVMFYAPYLTNVEIGSAGQAGGGPAFVAGEGGPFALVIVPVGAHEGPGHGTK
jgi:hypothetical protein